jgi:hypothetical protein
MLAVAILLAITAWSFIARPRRGAGRPRRGAGRDAGEGSSLAVPHGWSSPPPPAAAGASLAGHGRAWLGALGVAALIFVAGGPVALAVPLLACLAWLPPRSPGRTTAQGPLAWLPWLAFAGMVASGLLSAARPFGAGLLGPVGGPAQACALVALAAALTPAVAVPVRRQPASREAPADAGLAAPATTAGEADR